MAQVFPAHFRAEDVICRYAGEEFSVILSEASIEVQPNAQMPCAHEPLKVTIRYLDQTLEIGGLAFASRLAHVCNRE